MELETPPFLSNVLIVEFHVDASDKVVTLLLIKAHIVGIRKYNEVDFGDSKPFLHGAGVLNENGVAQVLQEWVIPANAIVRVSIGSRASDRNLPDISTRNLINFQETTREGSIPIDEIIRIVEELKSAT